MIKPGLTGWAQVRYTYGATVEDAIEKLQYDLFYIKNLSIALDLFIIFETVKTVLLRRGAVVTDAATGSPSDRQRDDRRRRRLLPRQRVRRRRAAPSRGTASRAASARTPSACCDIFDESRRPGDVLRARLGRRALPVARARDRRRRATRSRRTATAHRLVYDLTPAAFRDDIRRSKDVLEAATGAPVIGYRAPSYSVTPRSLWALDVLIEEGFRYDASIFPIHHDRYGIPISPRHPYLLQRGGALRRSAGLDRAVGPVQPADRRRRLFPDPSLRVDALGHHAAERRRDARRRSSICIRGKSIRISRACARRCSAGSVTTAISAKTEERLRALLRDFQLLDDDRAARARRSDRPASSRHRAAALRLVARDTQRSQSPRRHGPSELPVECASTDAGDAHVEITTSA